MDRQQKRYLKDIARFVGHEESKLKKQAGRIRRATTSRSEGRDRSGVTEDNWETLLDGQGGRKNRRVSLDEIAAELRAAAQAEGEESTGADGRLAGVVISVSKKSCRVFIDGREVDCIIPADIAVRQQSALAVGDRVVIESEAGVSRLLAILPRHSVLARPDPHNPHRQRLIAANVDVVIHVVSVKAPPLRTRLIDRYLIAIMRGGAQPVICANKIDLLDDDERAIELQKLEPYRELGVPVIACSTKTGEGLEAMRAEVEGKLCALVGHSGVGKSSILNAIDTRLELATNSLHRSGTGRHTTTASTLYDLGGGTLLIDTPGIREFGLWDLDRASLRDYFPEFTELSESCRFNDCTHVHEPDCEVKRRLESGDLRKARYDTYVRLYNDLE